MSNNYHVSEDGVSRVCKAQTPESCTVRASDGGVAPHGSFNSPQEAAAFAEQVNAERYGASSGKLSKRGGDRQGLKNKRLADEMIDESSRPQYIASINQKHFAPNSTNAGSKFTDEQAKDVKELLVLAAQQRGSLSGDDRAELIAAGANPKDFAPEASGIRYLKVAVKGKQFLRSTSSMKETDILEVREKGGNDGKPSSLSFAAPGAAEEVSFGTIVIGPKEGPDRKPIAGTETLYTAHPGIPTRGIRSDTVRAAGLGGGSTLTVGEFRKLFGRDIQVNSY